jgi:hypothetical protein
MIQRLSIILVALVMGGCTPTVYSSEVDQLATATTAITKSIPSRQDIKDAERNALGDTGLQAVLMKSPVEYSFQCDQQAYDDAIAFNTALGQNQKAQDEAIAKFATIKPCSLLASDEPAAGSSPKPEAGPAQAPAKKGKTAEERARAAAMEAAKRRALEAASAKTEPLRAPPCAPTCTLEDYTEQITAYVKNLQAIVSGKNVKEIQDALDGANKAIDGLLTTVNAPKLGSAAADAVVALAKLGLQQAQYEALRDAVLVFDDNWSTVSPYVVRAARFRYASLVRARAGEAKGAAVTAQWALNNQEVFSNPMERLTLYQLLNPRVDAANASLTAAIKSNPAAALQAFAAANSALAEALLDPKRQVGALAAALKTLNEQAAALKKALSPANK